MEIEEKSQKREKSSAYPSISLEEAINSLKKLQDNLGSGPYSRDAAAKGLGYSGVSGASASKIAAISYFGLLSKKNGVYTQTDLAKKILFPSDDSETRINILQAVKSPTLYGRLIERYNNQAIPQKLENILVTDYKISPKAANEAVEVFRNSIEFAGICTNGIISEVENIDSSMAVGAAQSSNIVNESLAKQACRSNELGKYDETISIKLNCGIVLLIPQSFDKNLAMGDFSQIIKNMEEAAKNMIDSRK